MLEGIGSQGGDCPDSTLRPVQERNKANVILLKNSPFSKTSDFEDHQNTPTVSEKSLLNDPEAFST